MMSAHPALVDQLIGNLVSNAIRYNRPGGRVDVAVRAEGEDAVISVTDTGIGIPAADLEKIFERFYRVDKSRSRDKGGTGLGLAIAKHAALQHGGSIQVGSEEGVGTTFTVHLPLRVTS